jgi:hypothetical protein
VLIEHRGFCILEDAMAEMMREHGCTTATCRFLVLCLVAGIAGCAFMRDPLDPRGKLDHRIVRDFVDLERAAHGHEAFERARRRVEGVKTGMSMAEVEAVMDAMIVTEQRGNEPDEESPRRKVVEGLLCDRDPTPLHRRWLFGYDEGGVELVGFALEFEREDPGDDDWTVRSIDRRPADDCPGGFDEES